MTQMEITPVIASHILEMRHRVSTLGGYYFVICFLESQTCTGWSFGRNNLWRKRRESKTRKTKKDKCLQCSREVARTPRNFSSSYIHGWGRVGGCAVTRWITSVYICRLESAVQSTALLQNCVFLVQLYLNWPIISSTFTFLCVWNVSSGSICFTLYIYVFYTSKIRLSLNFNTSYLLRK